MTRYHAERDRAEHEQQQRAAAAQAGRQLLDEHLRARGET